MGDAEADMCIDARLDDLEWLLTRRPRELERSRPPTLEKDDEAGRVREGL